VRKVIVKRHPSAVAFTRTAPGIFDDLLRFERSDSAVDDDPAVGKIEPGLTPFAQLDFAQIFIVIGHKSYSVIPRCMQAGGLHPAKEQKEIGTSP